MFCCSQRTSVPDPEEHTKVVSPGAHGAGAAEATGPQCVQAAEYHRQDQAQDHLPYGLAAAVWSYV